MTASGQKKTDNGSTADDTTPTPQTALRNDRRTVRIGVLLGAEPYQAHHVADIAWELAARPGFEVEIVAVLPESLSEISKLARSTQAQSVRRRLLRTPPTVRIAQQLRVFGSLKTAVLRQADNLRLLSSYDAIVTPTDHARFVRQRLNPRPRLIYVSHGIGGRAASYSSKYQDFDFVVLASRNDERRLLADRRIVPGRYTVAGYPKLETHRLDAGKKALFGNQRPVILFNPHSKRALRSFERFARPLIRHCARTGEFNLIVAPHVKLFSRRPRFLWRRWERMAAADRVIVDLGSGRCLDMTYTAAADIYVGDVSSQVYEFLSRPKPCIFLNAHRLDWRGNPDFPNWNLGDVAETPQEAIAAIRTAASRHHFYEPRQRDRIAEVIDTRPGAAARAADAIVSYMDDNAAL
jgi:hypothetical protein